MEDRLWFRQLLAGVDFAPDDFVAAQMVNFSYLIGDRATGEALVVDPAYDVGGLLDILDAEEMRLAGVLATHYHADHVGGDMMGHTIEGITAVLARHDVPIHVQTDEAPWILRTTGVAPGNLAQHASGDVVTVGEVQVELIHTPGHTPGSQCFLVDGKLIAGDTLFLNGCGRTDLPGGEPEELYRSLHERLARVPDNVVLYPGHLYSPEPSQPLGAVRAGNYVFRLSTPEQWMAMFAS